MSAIEPIILTERECNGTILKIPHLPLAAILHRLQRVESKAGSIGVGDVAGLRNCIRELQLLIDFDSHPTFCDWEGDVDVDDFDDINARWTCPGCGTDHHESLPMRREP